MNRKLSFIVLPLFIFLMLFSSCTNAEQFYSSGQYQNASDAVDLLKNPTVNDYYIKLKSLIALDNKKDAKESILLFMLLSNDSEKRAEVSNYFIEAKFSDPLIITALKPEDSIQSAITIYKAYVNIGDVQNAKKILNDYIMSVLSLKELNTLIINYPVDSDFIITMLSIWQTSITEEEKDTYLLLLERFSKLENVTESSYKVCIDIITRLENDEYYYSDPSKLIQIYKIKANILLQLHDTYNSNIYKKLVQQLEVLNEQL